LRISIVGAGYVGLVTGACLAEVGNNVLCLDLDSNKIATLQAGGLPIHESGLLDMVSRNVAAGRLAFTTDIDRAVEHGRIQFIAVGTPPDEDGSADLQYVLDAARSIGRRMTAYTVIVDKSTVPVGTGDKVSAIIADELSNRKLELSYSVVSNPEFLKEGAAIDDFMRPDRIIIGGDDAQAIDLMRQLYAPFNRNHDRIIVMDTKSAELTKYAANAMLATRISFMNEMANVAEKLGADIEMVRQGIGSDARIGYHFLYAGCGYGGSCFPKDVKALLKTANDDAGIALKVLAAVDDANEVQKGLLSAKIMRRFGLNLKGKCIAVWGLAFKPNTDDMRDAPSRTLISALLAAGASVVAYDPVAMPNARRIFAGETGISFADHSMSACAGADALVILTEWKEFRSPDFDDLRAKLKSPVIFDGRNLYDPAAVASLGFEYFPVGRAAVTR
jgi:UDPglucose 6-dehydrogenase